jgi:hypothetical protein
MKIFKELKKLGYKHYTEHTVEELDNLPLESKERIMEQALVLRWFRKKYKIHVSYGTTSDYHEERNGFVISNYIDGSRNNLFTNWEVGTYEEAELACLEKLIEIVEQKEK